LLSAVTDSDGNDETAALGSSTWSLALVGMNEVVAQ